ncbi:TPA: glycosyl transferase [Vibrio parahaemolyticus]|uniref:Glycosyl transferase n=1 Tax=Vibrio parahaemolyticus TaxID=670 RepID=A0A7M1W4R7_VIBPH|nr:hypothetical protein VP122_00010 [Vibrio parahaemolyticus]HCM0912768.1 glycosyl transferase [Vibrio parahaemolyticus]
MKIIKFLSYKFLKTYFISLIKLPVNINNKYNDLAKCIEVSRIESADLSSFNNVDSELIVSLTTYGSQINDVHYVIKSIITQTLRPSKIILWLDKQEYGECDIPLNLKTLYDYGLEIRFCKNYRSYKKIIPTIKSYPEYKVITIDDDYIYPSDMIELLVKENEKYPNYIIGHRAHKMSFDRKGRLKKYNCWDFETTCSKEGHDIFLTTGGGTLFPPNVFKGDFLDDELFMELCPTADDVWIKVNAIVNNVMCKKIDDSRDWQKRFVSIESSNLALSGLNVGKSMNDTQLRKVMNYFGIEDVKLKEK